MWSELLASLPTRSHLFPRRMVFLTQQSVFNTFFLTLGDNFPECVASFVWRIAITYALAYQVRASMILAAARHALERVPACVGAPWPPPVTRFEGSSLASTSAARTAQNNNGTAICESRYGTLSQNGYGATIHQRALHWLCLYAHNGDSFQITRTTPGASPAIMTKKALCLSCSQAG